MIGKGAGTQFVPRNSLTGDEPVPIRTGSSSSGVPATLSYHRPLPGDSGPLLPLQSPNAGAVQVATQPVAGQVQAPRAPGRLARARDLISDFVTATGRLVAGGDLQKYLAARAARLEKSLNEAIDAGKSRAELAKLVEVAVEVHYELSQWKGTTRKEEVELLQKCIDMHDHIQRIADPKLDMANFTAMIARKAHTLYFNLATGVEARRTANGFAWDGTKRQPSQVDLLACARGAFMNCRADVENTKPEPLRLADLYTVRQLQDLPLGDVVDGNALTKREVDLWCADPPQNPWPVEPRLLRFYDAAKHAAWEVRARENNAMRRGHLAQHMPLNPDPELAKRDNRENMADLIAGFAADLPEARG